MMALPRALALALLLWPLAGTAQTRMVADLNPGPDRSNPRQGAVVAGTYYFPADDGTHGRELWAYDLASGEARLVLDLAPGAAGGVTRVLGEHDGWLYVAGDDGTMGPEPWRIRLASGDAEPLADLIAGPEGSDPREFAVVETPLGSVFFAAGGEERLLWGYTPPEAPSGVGRMARGALAAVRMQRGGLVTDPSGLAACDECTEQPGSLRFLTQGAVYVVRRDGTEADEVHAAEDWFRVIPGWGFDGEEAIVTRGAFTSPDAGVEPVVSDLNYSTTIGYDRTTIYDLRPGPESSDPGSPVRIGDYLYLAADDGASGRELWRLDLRATAPVASGELVADIRPGPEGSDPSDLEVADRLYFRADDGESGLELWAHDPRTGATERVTDLRPGASSSRIAALVPAGDVLLFAADDGASGRELWAHGTCGASGTDEATLFRACDGLPSENADAVAVGTVAGREEVWAATTSGLVRYASGAWEAVPGPYRPPLAIGNGRAYAASARGLAVFDGTEWGEVPFDEPVGAVEAAVGGVWVAAGTRAYYSAGPSGEAFVEVARVASADVTIVQPTEDLAWIASFDPDQWQVPGENSNPGFGGVRELRRTESVAQGGAWTTEGLYTQPTEGLCLEQTPALDALPSGAVWAAYAPGWCREAHFRGARGGRRGRQMARYDGSTWTSRPVGGGGARRGAEAAMEYVAAVAADGGSETVWVGGDGLAYALDPGGEAWQILSASDLGVPDLLVRDLAVDASGAVWAATPRGVLRYAPALAAPAPLSPAPDARQAPLAPRLRWAVVPGAEAYDVQVALDPGFAVPVVSETASGLPTLALAASLDPAVRHFWRVRARRGSAASPWSEPLAFVTGGREWDVYTALEAAVPGGSPIAVDTDASGQAWTLWESVLSAVAVFDGEGWAWSTFVPDPIGLRAYDDGTALVTTRGNGGFDQARDGGWRQYGADGAGGVPLVDGSPVGCYGDKFDACWGASWASRGGGRVWAGGIGYFQDGTGWIEQDWTMIPPNVDMVSNGLAAPDGTLWLAASRAEATVAHFDPDATPGAEWTGYGTADGVPLGSIPHHFDAGGALWVSSPNGLAAFDGTAWRTVALPGSQEIWALERSGDALWAATPDGIARGEAPYAEGDWALTPYDPAGPHPATPVAALAVDVQGNAWVAGDADDETGASVLWNGRWARYTRADGALPSDAVTDLAAGSDGAVWVATRGGMARTTASGVFVDAEPAPEAQLALGLPRPNPASGAVTVPYRVDARGEATVEVFDVLGRRVAVLASGAHTPGTHVARLDTRGLAAGAYAVRLMAGERAEVRRLTVVR